MSIDIINNGSFRNYAYWNAINGANVEIRPNRGCRITVDESMTVTDTVPPGFYQVLELGDYKKKISLDISFQAAYSVDEATEGLDFSLYIYEITEYTKFATGEIWTYEVPTNYSDYVYKRNYFMSSYNLHTWSDFEASVVLDPGYYILGFTTNVFKSAENEGINNDYARYISDPLNALAVINVSAQLAEIDEVAFHNTLVNNSFESLDAPFDKWFTYRTTASDAQNDHDKFPCIDKLGNFCKKIRMNPDVELLDIKEGCGLNQVITSDFDCRAEVRFWHRHDTSGIGIARCYVYELSYYDSDDNSFGINSIVYDSINIFSNKDQWRYFQGFFSVEKGKTYMLSIVPPEGTQIDGDFYVDNVGFNLFTSHLGSSGNDGSFEKPYTEEDGILTFLSRNKPGYVFYDNSHPDRMKYIRLSNGEYYLTQYTDGSLFCDNMYSIPDEMYPYCQKYFYPDGTMAVDESFFWNNAIYTANYRGKAEFGCYKIFEIRTNIGSTIDMLPGEEKIIVANFNTQEPAATLTVTSSMPSVASVVSVDTDDNSGGKSNTSNTITIKGNSYGKTTITISYQNFDGTIPKAEIDVYIRDPIEYENAEHITLTMLTSVNYVALRSVLNLKCLVYPAISSDIPIDWISSDRTIAKVDSQGRVTPVELGECTITAINYGTDKSDICTLYVVEQTVDPTLVRTSVESLSLDKGEKIRITAELLNAKGNMDYVMQEVKWTTSNDKIATVDDYGFVRGIAKGDVIITCASAENPEIKKEIPVSVSGVSSALTDIKLNMHAVMLNYDDKYSHEYLTPTFIPSNTKETEVVWTSSDKELVEVLPNGRIFPTFKGTTYSGGPVIIKCTSTTNPFVFRTCEVSVVRDGDYFPTLEISTEELKTYIGRSVRVEYSTSYYYNIRKQVTITLTKPDGSKTNNTMRISSDYVTLDPVETGEFIMTFTCSHHSNVTTKTCKIFVYQTDEAPEFIKDLEVLYTLQNGSCVFRYYAEDAISDNLGHLITIDGSPEGITPHLCMYNGQNYHYYFGEGLTPGSHSAYITVSDNSSDIITDNTFAQSSTVRFTMPNATDRKAALNEAKVAYDVVKNDALNCLYELMDDRFVYENERSEFKARYLTYCVLYDNLADILEVCIEHINSQIGASQTEMATLSNALSSDGVSIASYSEGDYTNSNYQSITDMDYYQNECIKQLVTRVLELEARLDELTSNNK